MDKIRETRRRNLRYLASILGGTTELARRLKREQSQISHVIGNNPTKNIGNRLAANIERTLNLPFDWLSHEHEECIESSEVQTRLSPILPNNFKKINTQEFIDTLKNELLREVEKKFIATTKLLFETGKIEGIEQGKAEHLRTVATQLLQQDQPPKLVAKLLNLPLDEVLGLNFKRMLSQSTLD